MTGDLGHWERYYRGGAVVSCPMGSSEGYDLEVRAAWERFFAALSPGSCIVDIATGNGAVPLIALDVARALRRQFELHGVDLARIDPPVHVAGGASRFEGVRFHGGTGAEALPFPDASVDAVTSQYGIEYSDLGRSLPEVARVLRPGGVAQFISHHSQSVTLQKARATLALGERALKDLALFDQTRAYLREERVSATSAASIHRELSARCAKLRAEAAASSEPLFVNLTLDWLARLFERRTSMTLDALMLALDTTEQDSRAWLQRLRDLLAAAWSPEEIEQVTARARREGLEVEATELQMHRRELVGWRLLFRRT